MTSRASIEKLAPTGEGLVRTREGVGLVQGALPGEEVELEVVRVSRKIWRGRTVAVWTPSIDRRSGGHADGCPACDWAHFDLGAARAAKRDLFLETMARIGRLPPSLFGPLPIVASPPGYRLRSRFHVESREGRIEVGAFAPRTHRVERLDGCLALTESGRALLPSLRHALNPEEGVSEIATVESLDGSRRLARVTAEHGASGVPSAALARLFDGVLVVDAAGRRLESTGDERLWLSPAGRDLPATPDSFFQSNRFLVGALTDQVRAAAGAVEASNALDAFGGVGLFAGALLDAGHAVTSVESHTASAAEAELARDRWRANARWRIERAAVLDFASADPGREAVIVVDPPRGGLGLALAGVLAERGRRRFIYVSCDSATLARDLAVIVAGGWGVSEARLYDMFALTHRVEAVVVLDRA